jgi:hypothetical protein
MAPPIMAPGVVKVQSLMGFSLASLVMVSSLWSKISASNLPEILVQSLSMAVVTISCPVEPLGVYLDLLTVIGHDDVVHGPDVTAWIDPDGLA